MPVATGGGGGGAAEKFPHHHPVPLRQIGYVLRLRLTTRIVEDPFLMDPFFFIWYIKPWTSHGFGRTMCAREHINAYLS